jgi:preprotein translocase subunit SecE
MSDLKPRDPRIYLVIVVLSFVAILALAHWALDFGA